MDNRRSARKRMRRHVTLDAPRVGTVLADMLDVSLGGAFVEADAAVLPYGGSVAIDFDLTDGGQEQSFRLDATIVRRTSAGAGLMFRDMQADVIRALSAALAKYSGLESGPR